MSRARDKKQYHAVACRWYILMKWCIIMHKTNFNVTSLSECCFTPYCFLPEYTQILGENQGCSTYSRLAHARNAVVRGGTCACACTTPNLHQPGLYCTNDWGLVESATLCSLGCSHQTSSKISIRSTCVAWKEWTQISNYNLNIFVNFNLCGWYWDSYHEVLYMNHGVIIIKPNLTLSTT